MTDDTLKYLYAERNRLQEEIKHIQYKADSLNYAIKVVEEKLGVVPKAIVKADNEFDKNQLFDVVIIDAPIKTLKANVEDAIEAFNGREFTVPMVEKTMHSRGIRVNGDSRGRISLTLSKMFKSGVILRTREGAGKTPHTYKAKS